MNWRLIETAPKDGNWILGFIDIPMLIRWNARPSERFVDNGNGNYRKESYDDGSWITGKGFFYSPVIPTHWMPLPDKPSDNI